MMRFLPGGVACALLLAAGTGCVETLRPLWIPKHGIDGRCLRNGGIHVDVSPPGSPLPPPPPDKLPTPPTTLDPKKNLVDETPQTDAPLDVSEVERSIETHFPLILAAEQERFVAAGQRLAAEGVFDTNLKSRYIQQAGTFPSNRFDVSVEQPTPLYGMNVFTGYRSAFGKFPVYYGDRDTADGGEVRAGLQLPLLKDGSIDRRRAAIRQALITEQLADPTIRRARIDALRAGTKAYWNWIAAGEQYRIAQTLLRIASERQAGLETQFKNGQISEFPVVDNQRVIAEREGMLIASERRLQQTALELSLFLRDTQGEAVVVASKRLPASFGEIEPMLPHSKALQEDVEWAWRNRPELIRFQLLKERATVDLRLAENQLLPALNANVYAAEDLGPGKKATGTSALDRENFEASVTLEVPLQRRDAQGKAASAQATLAQIQAQERYARDAIQAEVLDTHSALERTLQRLRKAKEERNLALKVAEQELERFRKGQSTLLEVNFRELAAAGARSKVVDASAELYRATADFRAALGWKLAGDPK